MGLTCVRARQRERRVTGVLAAGRVAGLVPVSSEGRGGRVESAQEPLCRLSRDGVVFAGPLRRVPFMSLKPGETSSLEG
jgi:hypothetical protein